MTIQTTTAKQTFKDLDRKIRGDVCDREDLRAHTLALGDRPGAATFCTVDNLLNEAKLARKALRIARACRRPQEAQAAKQRHGYAIRRLRKLLGSLVPNSNESRQNQRKSAELKAAMAR